MGVTVLQGDCRDVLATLQAESVHCCVTSPPYFGLRDYGVDGQIGLEQTPDAFVSELVAVFREVRRVLRDNGTLWLNLGDTYTPVNYGPNSKRRRDSATSVDTLQGKVGHWHADRDGPRSATLFAGCRDAGLKQKDLIGIPWMVAFALRADGWYLRQDIIWSKPNPMPESVRDRCTKAHEYIFLLSKSPRYYFDSAAMQERAVAEDIGAMDGGAQRARDGSNANAGRNFRSNSFARTTATTPPPGQPTQHRADREDVAYVGTRNKRSVWTVATQPFSEAHFATFPPALIEPCIKAGCPEGGTVLDPFFGAGTTGLVADRLQRSCIGIELNPAYAEMARNRIHGDAPLFAEVA